MPLRGHQSKNVFSESFEEAGSAKSLIAAGFLPPAENVILPADAIVGRGWTRADFSESGIQTIISERPRLAHAKYGMALMFRGCFTNWS